MDTPWSLPDGWEWIPLEKLCSHFYGGGTPKRSRPEYFGGDIVWVTPTDLDANNPCQKINTSRIKLTTLGLESSSAKLVPVGTVLFSSRATIGKIAVAGVPLCTNQGFANLVCNEHLNNHYLAWCLRTLTDEIKKLATSTTYLEVNRGNLRRFTIPIPFPDCHTKSLDIQHRIVVRIEALIAEVKESRNLLERMYRDTRQLISTTLEEVFKKLAYEQHSEQLANHVSHLTSGPRNWSQYASPSNNGSLFIRAGNVGFARMNLQEIERLSLPPNIGEERAKVTSKDVLLTITGAKIGQCCVVPDHIERAYVNQHVALIRLRESLEPRYLMWFVLSPSGGIPQITAMQYGQTKPGLNLNNVREISLPVPEKSEQRQIISYLDSIQFEVDKMRNLLEQDAKRLDHLEASILERAFRGEL